MNNEQFAIAMYNLKLAIGNLLRRS